MDRRPIMPPKRPKEPPKPLMKFARPAMRTMIWRLEKILRDEDNSDIADLLQRSRAWPTSAVDRSKEEVMEIRKRAGALVMEFNQRWSDKDDDGFIKFY